MIRPEDVTRFWLETCSPEQWYGVDPDLDAQIRAQFAPAWDLAMAGKLAEWATTPQGALALVILTDQFPRNMYRGAGQAFASDGMARSVAKRAVERGFDLRIEPPARQFFYLPLEHSECLSDQERAVRLIAARLPGPQGVLHARAHREIIRRFGRFPFRNAALGRRSTAAEAGFLAKGGYGEILRELSAKAA